MNQNGQGSNCGCTIPRMLEEEILKHGPDPTPDPGLIAGTTRQTVTIGADSEAETLNMPCPRGLAAGPIGELRPRTDGARVIMC
jgi:hypothetical protein